MKRTLLPAPHAEFESLSKLELLRLSEELLDNDPVVVEYCVAFVCAETRGLWHGRARAMMCRRLKHAQLARSQNEKLQACILGRLEQGNFSEQFKDQLRLAIGLAPKTAVAACQRSLSSTLPHVRRYCAWALSLPTIAIAA
jgi:hypothetical protein